MTTITDPLPRIDGRCSWCGVVIEPPARPQGGGRSQRFCTTACRMKHYRWRQLDPETRPDPPAAELLRR